MYICIGYKLLGCGVCNLFCCSLLEDDKGEDSGDRICGELVERAEAELLQCRVSLSCFESLCALLYLLLN